MEAEQLALEIRNRLQPIVTPAFEAVLPKEFQVVKDVLDYCCQVYSDQFIREQTDKDCCG